MFRNAGAGSGGGMPTPAVLPPVSASAAPSASATALASGTPSSSAAAAEGVVACPVAAPAGQHQLGSPGGPGQGQHRDPSLSFCGRGTTTIPAGTTRFTTGAKWGLGIADSCPTGSSGEAGMNTVLSVSEITPAGGQGPDTASEQGDWTDSGAALMATGGNYQLQVLTVSPDCVWHIAVYPS